MTKIQLPSLKLPGFQIARGSLLNIALLGKGLIIPPWDITFWKPVTIWEDFDIFNTDWIVEALTKPLEATAKLVWTIFEDTLNKWAEDYYETHKEES